MRITKRELLFSVVIVILMIVIGIFISNFIENKFIERNGEYYKAVKISDKSQFQYALNTSIGNSLVYGEIKAANPVSISEISGEWFYIEKVTERYTQHIRTKTTTDSKGNTHTTTQVYYEWDVIDNTRIVSDEFEFMGKKFNNSLNGLPVNRINLKDYAVNEKSISRNYMYKNNFFIEKEGNIRWYFLGVPVSFNATIEAKIGKETLSSFTGTEMLDIYYDKDIAEVIDSIENEINIIGIVFWISWFIVIFIVVLVFYYRENYWLEN